MGWLAIGMTTRELGDGPTIIGSGADAGWRVATADLSPRHFVVEHQADSASIRANSGDNVVVLNGRQIGIAAEPLADGDVVHAGSGRFVYTVDPPLIVPTDDPPIRAAHLVDDAARIAHPLLGRTTPIGRDASNSVLVRDPTASRFHAEVRREAGGYAVHSLGGGTLLNGQPLEASSVLFEGDTLEIAGMQLRFTTAPPRAGVTIATPHSTRNDDTASKPTLGKGSTAVPASRRAAKPTPGATRAASSATGSRMPAVIGGLVVVLGAAWWFMRS